MKKTTLALSAAVRGALALVAADVSKSTDRCVPCTLCTLSMTISREAIGDVQATDHLTEVRRGHRGGVTESVRSEMA